MGPSILSGHLKQDLNRQGRSQPLSLAHKLPLHKLLTRTSRIQGSRGSPFREDALTSRIDQLSRTFHSNWWRLEEAYLDSLQRKPPWRTLNSEERSTKLL